jgi:phenylalanine-4-hydroxylase
MATETVQLTPAQSKNPQLVTARPFLIEQDWSAYTPEQHATWAELVRRCMPQLRKYACQEYLDGFEQIGLREDSIPDLAAVSAKLEPRTRWNSTPVSGYLPTAAFFEMLASRRFPTTTWLRDRNSLEYTPEPDIFHDVFGHVPMHAHPVFADFLYEYGSLGGKMAGRTEELTRMSRLFWFTVEFGVIRQRGEIRVYGSGLISSHGECSYVINNGPEIRDFNLDQVLEHDFSISEMQPVLYAVESFQQIYEAAKEAEQRFG